MGKRAYSVCRGGLGHGGGDPHLPAYMHRYKRKLFIASQGARAGRDYRHGQWGGCLALVIDVGRSSVAGNARH